MRKDNGTVADIMTTGIFMLAMTVLMMAFLDDMQLIQQKMEVNQVARRYILRMETVGYLEGQDCAQMLEELEEQGVTEVDLGSTTLSAAGYGEQITLEIKGKLGGQYAFVERRISTAKN